MFCYMVMASILRLRCSLYNSISIQIQYLILACLQYRVKFHLSYIIHIQTKIIGSIFNCSKKNLKAEDTIHYIINGDKNWMPYIYT